MRSPHTAGLLAGFLTLIALACSERAPPEPTPSATAAAPIATATPRDAATDCQPAPTELGDPGPMRRRDVDGAAVFIARNVSAEDEERVLDGLAAARVYLARHLGGVRESICLEVRASEQRAGAALTIDNRVIVFTQPGGWTRPYPWLLSRATAHEYVHVWASEVANDFARPNSSAYGPGWMVEGVAEYLSMLMVIEAGLAPEDEAETRTNSLLRLSTASLNDLNELPLPNAEDYATAELAVSRLVARRDITALRRYYAAIGNGTSWPAAFALTFGIPPVQFTQEFAATPSP